MSWRLSIIMTARRPPPMTMCPMPLPLLGQWSWIPNLIPPHCTHIPLSSLNSVHGPILPCFVTHLAQCGERPGGRAFHVNLGYLLRRSSSSSTQLCAPRLRHDGNPALPWCIGNVVGTSDWRSDAASIRLEDRCGRYADDRDRSTQSGGLAGKRVGRLLLQPNLR